MQSRNTRSGRNEKNGIRTSVSLYSPSGGAAFQGFDESDTRPVWRGFARNIGQELLASGGDPLVAAKASRKLPSVT
jgi:hypothetical protein